MSRCPVCGGSDVRQITPGFFECTSQIDVSVPPGLFGNPTLIGGSHVCGHHFQDGTSTASPPCGIPGCGRDSIGTCQGGCGRRLCGLHGPPAGSFICEACQVEREREDARRRDLADAEARAAADERRAEVAEKLSACQDAREAAGVLNAHVAEVAAADCRATWVRLATSGAVAPTHEIVKVEGHPTLVGFLKFEVRGSWSESPEGRSDLWCAPDAGYHPRGHGASGFDVLLDAEGSLWRSRRSDVELSIYDRNSREHQLILPKGSPFKTRRGSRDIGHRIVFYRAVGALWCDAVDAGEFGPERYARVVASALTPNQTAKSDRPT